MLTRLIAASVTTKRIPAALVALLAPAFTLAAQTVATPFPPTAYPGSPSVVLAQPSSTATPVPLASTITFRLTPGEATDPINALSFTVTIDGLDVTKHYSLAGNEAWGPLIASSATADSVASPHRVVASACSTHGVCTSIAVVISTIGKAAVDSAANASKHSVSSGSAVGLLEKAIEIAHIVTRH